MENCRGDPYSTVRSSRRSVQQSTNFSFAYTIKGVWASDLMTPFWIPKTVNKKLAKTQSGNCKIYSPWNALNHVIDDLLQATDDEMISAIVLLGMSKALGSIIHDLLLQKLQVLGVTSQSLDVFHSNLVGLIQRVRIQNTISDALPLKYLRDQ